MASRPMELPGASGAGWLRTLTGPVRRMSVSRAARVDVGVRLQLQQRGSLGFTRQKLPHELQQQTSPAVVEAGMLKISVPG